MRQQPGYRQGGSTTCSGPQPVLQLFQTELLSEAGLAGSGPLSEHRHPSQVSVPGLSGVGVGASSSREVYAEPASPGPGPLLTTTKKTPFVSPLQQFSRKPQFSFYY